MEKGKIYEVWFKDDIQVRHKTFVYVSSTDGLLEFINTRNKKIEYIPVVNIVRIEGEGDE